jgi:hypothetical protein
MSYHTVEPSNNSNCLRTPARNVHLVQWVSHYLLSLGLGPFSTSTVLLMNVLLQFGIVTLIFGIRAKHPQRKCVTLSSAI